jgi:hypothetical protein
MTLVLGLVEHFVSFVRDGHRSKELFCHANVKNTWAIRLLCVSIIFFIAQLWRGMVSGKINFGLVLEFVDQPLC